ncbi:MAG TPA: sulfotransferase [Steroidobacteraceae bacterium]|nr:sulfotransferase [Steroidobacteraceae bacterium]
MAADRTWRIPTGRRSTGNLQEWLRTASRLRELNRIPEAITAYERVLARRPDLPDSWYNLGLLQRRAGNLDAAVSCYRRALALGISAPEEVHLNCAFIYAHLRQGEATERELRAALQLNPDYIPALLNLANLCEDFGRRSEACDAYRRVLTIEPKHYEALARLANALPSGAETGLGETDSAHDPPAMVTRLRQAIADPSASAAARASLGFALGRLLDARGHYDAAFAAYRRANLDSRLSAGPAFRGYDPRAHEAFVEELIRAFQVPSARLDPNATSGVRPIPVFICGMFRSGSTLTERVLSAHPEAAAGGELGLIPALAAGPLRPFPSSMASISPAALSRLAGGYIGELSRRCPAATFVTDKRPDNFLYLGLIKSLFPAAKIVHTTRAPLDNCLSIYFLHLHHDMSYAMSLRDIGHYYRQYCRLMAHWRTLYGQDIIDFEYDTFVRDPKPAARRLFGFLGLEWDDRYLNPASHGAVQTASVWQVREPIYQRSSGRARHYQPWLGELQHALEWGLVGQASDPAEPDCSQGPDPSPRHRP